MNWWLETGVILVTVGILAVPGGLISWLLGLRRYTLIAAAAPFSMVVIAVAAAINVVVPFHWGILPFLLVTAVLAALAWTYRRLTARFRASPDAVVGDPSQMRMLWPLIAVAIAAACLITRLTWVIGEPSSISQTFDNIYHLNAVEYVLQYGQIAPTRQLIPGFYPSAWHALTALVAGITAAPVPVAVNAVSVVLGGLVWPVAIVFLTIQIVGHNRTAVVASGVLSAATAAFPLLMLDFGVLYPNLLSIVLLPSALGALIAVAKVGRSWIAAPQAWLMVLAWVPTMALSHPSTLMAFFGIGFWPAAWGGVRYFRSRWGKQEQRGRVVLSAVVWVVGIAAAAMVFIVFRPTRDQAFWLPTQTVPQAVLQVFTNAAATGVPAIALSVFMIAGLIAVIVWRREQLWLALSFATLATVYIIGVAYPPGRLRYLLTGTWYSDMVRVASLFPALAIPLAALGTAAVVALIARLLVKRAAPSTEKSSTEKSSTESPRTWPRVAIGAGLAALLVGTQLGSAMATESSYARASYGMTASSPLITPDEEALLLRLPETTPEDAVIVGNPWTGTSLSYALGNRWAMIPHIYQMTTEDMTTILLSLNQALDDPEVCDAVRRTGASHVLDFGPVEVHGFVHEYEGLQDLADSGVVKLIDSEGDSARLYEIIGCR